VDVALVTSADVALITSADVALITSADVALITSADVALVSEKVVDSAEVLPSSVDVGAEAGGSPVEFVISVEDKSVDSVELLSDKVVGSDGI